jgi:DNA-binding response OmpR family regulator
MAGVLSIESDQTIIDAILQSLPAYDYQVDVARTARDGIARVMAIDYDAITLGRNLPDLNALAILSTIRHVGLDTPVLFLSRTSALEERIDALRAGGDDYLCTPFERGELAARIEVLLRRRAQHRALVANLRVGALELDMLTRKARHHGQELDLQPTESRILEYLMRHPGQVLTRAMIFEGVWGARIAASNNLIDVHISHLRKKVAALHDSPVIRTVRGAGYRFG